LVFKVPSDDVENVTAGGTNDEGAGDDGADPDVTTIVMVAVPVPPPFVAVIV
jgi:hypothetical protein